MANNKDINERLKNGLIGFLPEIFYTNKEESKNNFLTDYLKSIEKIITKADVNYPKAIQEKLEKIPQLFHPKENELWQDDIFVSYFSMEKKEFLEWLSGWFDYMVEDEISLSNNIDVISELISIYRIRGTVEGMQKALDLFAVGGGTVTIADPEIPTVTLQDGTTIPQPGPYSFHVLIYLSQFNLVKLQEQLAMAAKIIEREKPVHVTYDLDFETPSFTVEVQSHVAVDTLIGG